MLPIAAVLRDSFQDKDRTGVRISNFKSHHNLRIQYIVQLYDTTRYILFLFFKVTAWMRMIKVQPPPPTGATKIIWSGTDGCQSSIVCIHPHSLKTRSNQANMCLPLKHLNLQMLLKTWLISGQIPSICQLPIGHMAVGVFQHGKTVPLCEGSVWHSMVLLFSRNYFCTLKL